MVKRIKKFYIYLANLGLPSGTEPGKIRPVVVIQTDLLNKESHNSTIVCPLTSEINKFSTILRLHLPKKESNLKKASDILIDQIRAIDNRRFIKQIGKLGRKHKEQLINNLKIILFE